MSELPRLRAGQVPLRPPKETVENWDERGGKVNSPTRKTDAWGALRIKPVGEARATRPVASGSY